MRNTRVVDVVAALRDCGVHVDVHDPWVDTVDVQKEYWLALVTTPQPEAYDGVSWPWRMTATARQAPLRGYDDPGHVFYDLKSVFARLKRFAAVIYVTPKFAREALSDD